jgi:hypothetical protein
MTLTFTQLESAILDAICDADLENPAGLKLLLDGAQLIERDNTGHGFNTRFNVSRDHPSLTPKSNPVDGPIAHMVDLGPGMLMGFLLWFSDGYPNCLEGYQYGDESGERVDLRQWDLSALSFRKLDWAVGRKLH